MKNKIGNFGYFFWCNTLIVFYISLFYPNKDIDFQRDKLKKWYAYRLKCLKIAVLTIINLRDICRSFINKEYDIKIIRSN